MCRPGGDTVVDTHMVKKMACPVAIVGMSRARQLPLCHHSLGHSAEVGYGRRGRIYTVQLHHHLFKKLQVARIEINFKIPKIFLTRAGVGGEIFFCLFFFLSFSLIYAATAAYTATAVTTAAATATQSLIHI